MATNLWRRSFQAAVRSGRGVNFNGSRAASTASGGGGGMNLIIAAGVGIAGITTFSVSSKFKYVSSRQITYVIALSVAY